MRGLNPHIGLAKEGRAWNVLDHQTTCRIPSSATGGQFALVEIRCTTPDGPPLHLHEREDELFYVIEGALEITVGEEVIRAEAGDCAFLPRGIAHTYRNLGGPSRFTVLLTPGGFEDYFAVIDELMTQGQATPERLAETAAPFGLSYLMDAAKS